MKKNKRHPRITAHRAGAKLGPENSLTALRRAIAAGAAYAEIDVQLTADAAVVVVHDPELKTSGVDKVSVWQSTLGQLQDIVPTARERISTLEEFIAAARGRIKLNIELKDYGHSARLPARVVEILRSKDFLAQAVVSSSSIELLLEIRRLEPRLGLGLVLASQPVPDELPVEFLSVHHESINGAMVRKAHRGKKEIHAWTVNESAPMLRLLALGVDNVITDDPVLGKQTLSRFERVGTVGRWWLRWKKS